MVSHSIVTRSSLQLKSQRAIVGDKIKFKRMGLSFIGEVSLIREESVIVKLKSSDAETLKLDTPYTVVSHKNYVILER